LDECGSIGPRRGFEAIPVQVLIKRIRCNKSGNKENSDVKKELAEKW